MSLGTPPFVSHFDGNQVPSMMGVVGTLGTADAGGTSQTLPIGVNPSTGAMYVEDLSSTGGTTNVMILGGTLNSGTLNTLGTLGSVSNIGVIHNAGSIQALPQVSIGTIPQVSVGTLPTVSLTDYGTNINIVTGTINSIPQVSVGTVPNPLGSVVVTVGTITTIPQISIGTIPQVSIGTLPSINVATGSQQTLGTIGTVEGIGTISNIGVIHNAGTIQAIPQISVGTVPQISIGTIPQISVGTLPTLNLTTGTITTGSITNIATLHNGTVVVASGTMTSVSGITNGSINVLSGTIQSSGTITGVGVVSNLTNGSINILTGTVTRLSNIGTIESGTIQFDEKPIRTGTPLHTRGTAGVATWGTLVAASGAGTKQYVSRVSAVVTAGTVDIAITNIGVGGSTGAGVLERGQFPAGGGITNNYFPIISSGTNGTLAYWMGGAGTVDIVINYWQAV